MSLYIRLDVLELYLFVLVLYGYLIPVVVLVAYLSVYSTRALLLQSTQVTLSLSQWVRFMAGGEWREAQRESWRIDKRTINTVQVQYKYSTSTVEVPSVLVPYRYTVLVQYGF